MDCFRGLRVFSGGAVILRKRRLNLRVEGRVVRFSLVTQKCATLLLSKGALMSQVFISYRQTDDEQRRCVRAFGERLRDSGIDVGLDHAEC